MVNTAENGFSLAEMEDALAVNEIALARHTPFVTIRDFRVLTRQLSALQRRRLAQWQEEHRAAIATYNLGCVNIIPSPVLRGVAQAIAWMSEPPSPELSVDTASEAVEHTFSLLQTAGVELPSALNPDLLLSGLSTFSL